jgi:hypothetical protein
MSMRFVQRTAYRTFTQVLWFSVAIAAVACSSKDNPGPNCPQVTTTALVSFKGNTTATVTDSNSIEGIVNIYCQGCHGSTVNDRRGAPLEVVFDTYDDTVRWGLASDEQMASNQMPPPPAQLSQSIICTFDNWVTENYPP